LIYNIDLDEVGAQVPLVRSCSFTKKRKGRFSIFEEKSFGGHLVGTMTKGDVLAHLA